MNEIIINLVKDYPCLYDKRNVSYKDKNLKKKIWCNIAKYINETHNVNLSGNSVIFIIIGQLM